MKISIVTVVAFLVIDVCLSDKHTFGFFSESFHKIHDVTLIDSNNNEPRSYDILLKYFVSFFDTVRYVEIDVNSPSTGILHRVVLVKKLSWSDFDYPVTHFYAKIHVNETLRCKATLKIYLQIPKSEVRYHNLEATSSVTYVYQKRGTSLPSKKHAYSSIGKRVEGDKLIYFKSRNVTNISRFPSASFEYSGDDYITYVGFSFNSPTAMAFLNTSFISGTDFNAIVYDMNTEHFVANLSIYGKEAPLRNGEGVIALV